MMYHILLTCSFVALAVQGQRVSKSIQSQPRVAYSSSIIHAYPGTNELYGESSIKVNIPPPQVTSVHTMQNRGTTAYGQPGSNNFYRNPSAVTNYKDTGSFNVGYNLSFSDPRVTHRRKQMYTRVNNQKIENAEVITGKSKKNEKVQAPNIGTDLSPQDFVSRAYLRQKLINSQDLNHASSLIKTKANQNHVKYLNPIREQQSKYPSQSPKFTYNTQQVIFKDIIKATKPDPIQLNQEFKTSFQTSGRWKNVSPELEVGQSVEPQIGRFSHHNNIGQEQPQNFDHDNVLKNSQLFDFSNAHGKILYGDNDSANDNSPEGSEHYTQESSNYGRHELSNQIDMQNNINRAHPYSDINNINIEAHIPPRFKGVKPLPLDTSLLKDAVLLTDSKDVPKDKKVLPIRFDISSIQSAMQEHLAGIQNYASQQNTYVSHDQNQQLQNSHVPPNPSYTTRSTYGDSDQSANQNNFKVYEKPESIDTTQYRMDYSYDQKNSNFDNDVYKIVSMRPPPVRQNIKY